MPNNYSVFYFLLLSDNFLYAISEGFCTSKATIISRALQLTEKNKPMNVLALFAKVKAFVFDVDGVLSDGSLLVLPDIHPEGKLIMARSMSTKDGYAFQFALKCGYSIAIISGGKYSGVEQRLALLGVQHIFMGVEHKMEYFKKFIQSQGLQSEEVLYMGDDIPDYDVLKIAGVKTCPADAVTEIKEIADYISPLKGGEGCARDVIEKTLKLQGKWNIDTTTRAI